MTRWTPSGGFNFNYSDGTEADLAIFTNREIRQPLAGAGGKAWVNDNGTSRSQGTAAGMHFFPDGNLALGSLCLLGGLLVPVPGAHALGY